MRWESGRSAIDLFAGAGGGCLLDLNNLVGFAYSPQTTSTNMRQQRFG